MNTRQFFIGLLAVAAVNVPFAASAQSYQQPSPNDVPFLDEVDKALVESNSLFLSIPASKKIELAHEFCGKLTNGMTIKEIAEITRFAAQGFKDEKALVNFFGLVSFHAVKFYCPEHTQKILDFTSSDQ